MKHWAEAARYPQRKWDNPIEGSEEAGPEAGIAERSGEILCSLSTDDPNEGMDSVYNSPCQTLASPSARQEVYGYHPWGEVEETRNRLA